MATSGAGGHNPDQNNEEQDGASAAPPSQPPKVNPHFIVAPGRDPLPADSPENVAVGTESVFRSFVVERFSMDQENRTIPDSTPSAPLSDRQPNPLSVEAQVGRQLAMFGDEINRLYGPQFDQMIKLLNPTDESAFSSFTRVAKLLFRDSVITWGRVVALFFLGYRIAVNRLAAGSRHFLDSVEAWFVDFLRLSKIYEWVAAQGGWCVVLRLVVTYPLTISPVTSGLVIGVVCWLTAYMISRKFVG